MDSQRTKCSVRNRRATYYDVILTFLLTGTTGTNAEECGLVPCVSAYDTNGLSLLTRLFAYWEMVHR